MHGAVYLVPQVNWEEHIVLRKISFVAAIAAVLGMPAIAMAAGHGGGGGHWGGGGGMHMGAMHVGGMHTGGMHMSGMHSGPVFHSQAFGNVGHVQSFRSAGVFPGRHAFFDRGFHHHHHHHRFFFASGLGYYDYGGYGSCYRQALTPWGWRWTWVCGDNDYDY
jgi:hypothetical protein